MLSSRQALIALLLVQYTSAYNIQPSDRRAFLQKTAGTVAASIAGGSLLDSVPVFAAEDQVAVDVVASSTTQTFPQLRIANGKIIEMPKIGTGAWAWGDSFFWGYNSSKEDDELHKVFDYCAKNGGAFFDTAELYGFGRSETLIGQFEQELGTSDITPITVATKFGPYPWRTDRKSVVTAAQASVKRLGGRSIDLYQIHFPNAYANAAYWDGIADAYDKGLIKAVGVSNYGKDAVKACHDALQKRGIPLASNQIQLSLLYREPLNNGLKQVCDDLGVKVISYSPLGLGLLTGKYNADNLPTGPRKLLGEKLFKGDYAESAQKLITTMEDIGKSRNVSMSQVALNWNISKGTTPIPGARTLKQAKQNLSTLSWSLTEDEVARLDDASSVIPSLTPPESAPFPKVDKDTGLIMFDS